MPPSVVSSSSFLERDCDRPGPCKTPSLEVMDDILLLSILLATVMPFNVLSLYFHVTILFLSVLLHTHVYLIPLFFPVSFRYL
jgi:hypothetical protein